MSELMPAVLSDREIEVLELVAEGYTNKVIGVKLFISLYTVKAHLRVIALRLGAIDRANAVAIAMKSGIIEGKNIKKITYGRIKWNTELQRSNVR